MIRLINLNENNKGYTVQIQGPYGVLEIRDLVWINENRIDLIELCYKEAWAVLQGAYHCCFSIPGKVLRIK